MDGESGAEKGTLSVCDTVNFLWLLCSHTDPQTGSKHSIIPPWSGNQDVKQLRLQACNNNNNNNNLIIIIFVNF